MSITLNNALRVMGLVAALALPAALMAQEDAAGESDATTLPALSPTALAAFERFAEGLESLDATFIQTLRDETGFLIAQSEGRLAAVLPGRLDWEVVKPNPQRIVADGNELWNYEPSLDQVIVQRQGDLAVGSPLQVLANPGDATRHFRVARVSRLPDETLDLLTASLGPDQAAAANAEWTGVHLLPLSPAAERDSDFSEIELWIDADGGLAMLAFVDLFGQRTEMLMTSFVRNPEIAPARFQFVVPDGTDVFRP